MLVWHDKFLAAHVSNMSTDTTPVHDLKSDVVSQWNPEQVQALQRIKEILSTAPVLNYSNPSIWSVIQANMV